MRQSFGALRVTLAVSAIVMTLVAYLAFFRMEFFARFFLPPFPDAAHVHLLFGAGAYTAVLAVGSIFAFFQPLKNSGIITMLLLSHFAFFLVDVVVLVQGSPLPVALLLSEMAYLLFMCILFIRFYPVPLSQESISGTADVLVDTIKKSLSSERREQQKKEKELLKLRKKMEEKKKN